jgi:hypothetical protein
VVDPSTSRLRRGRSTLSYWGKIDKRTALPLRFPSRGDGCTKRRPKLDVLAMSNSATSAFYEVDKFFTMALARANISSSERRDLNELNHMVTNLLFSCV